jgi:aspartyl-tRNA(Asn)/glutamyl-tRNA(Gln) amidotransferase subunit B
MIRSEIREKYTPTIGIECHVQLKTKTKLFAAVDNDARDAAPNTLVSHICFGLPGALPVLNKEAIRLVSRAAFALGTEPARFSKFDRKHYFYPDLPKGYQISQYEQPLVTKGAIDVPLYDEQTKESHMLRIGITRAHLEEDAGKSTHPTGGDYSLVDLNRAGTPLLEIVSEPDIHSAREAKAYVHELYLRMKYADVSDCDLYLGHMRFDVNVSVSSDPARLGTRSETKNLNSFRGVEKAIEFEIDRQIELLEKGQAIVQETRGWDDAKQKSFTQRTKEEAHDYRYMPDPDLPPVVLSEEYVAGIRAEMPLLPADYRTKFAGLGLGVQVIEDILAEPDVARQIERCLEQSTPEDARRIAFWLLRPAHEDEAAGVVRSVDDAELIALSRLVDEGKLSSSAAKEVLDEMLTRGGTALAIAEAKSLAENPKAAQDVKNGEARAIGFLVGQIMKLSQGKANPGLAQQVIKQMLGI